MLVSLCVFRGGAIGRTTTTTTERRKKEKKEELILTDFRASTQVRRRREALGTSIVEVERTAVTVSVSVTVADVSTG
jgi:hypothetical protein